MLQSFLGSPDGDIKKKENSHDQEQLKAQIIGRMRQFGRITDRHQIKNFRDSIGKKLGVSGNNLSGLAVLDLGAREVVLLVAEKLAGQSAHMELRERLGREHYKLADERLADVAVIAVLNEAIGKVTNDTTASDVNPLVDELFASAVTEKATDIHLCCREKTGMVLLRIHSRIFKYRQYDVETCKQMAGYMFSIMAESRSQSTGTFSLENKSMSCMIRFSHKGLSYKLRYKFIRLADGWDVIIRILPMEIPGEKNKSFAELGYENSQIRLLELSVTKSIGLIAITGPTGSGKSTTLKTMMEFDPKRQYKKRYSVEDPVEYKIYGVSQISIQRSDHEQEDDGKAWGGVLRDVLRADPNDIMVGETRDRATAKIVADFVLTGHKIYTTLHTASAIGSVLRLFRLGLDRQVLSDRQFIAALIFQRLLPVLCPKCKKPAADVLPARGQHLLTHKFGLNINQIYCSADEGCEHCGGRGIIGSTVVAEVLSPDKVLRQHIAEGNDDKAEQYWRKSRTAAFDDRDMVGKTAFEHGLYKVSQGLIDPRDLEIEFEPLESYEVVEPGDSQ
ncbi:GspE/PulE family protein [Alicycliphilus denitrificans]|uniref:GspE/PulE family protein n=1 Tax=Alicycliphilus denitrificans TaxID=179636 RepID=UPI00384ACE0F